MKAKTQKLLCMLYMLLIVCMAWAQGMPEGGKTYYIYNDNDSPLYFYNNDGALAVSTTLNEGALEYQWIVTQNDDAYVLQSASDDNCFFGFKKMVSTPFNWTISTVGANVEGNVTLFGCNDAGSNKYLVMHYNGGFDQGSSTFNKTKTDFSSDFCFIDNPATIEFEDNEVKNICLNNWDTNNDGIFTREECVAITDIGDTFKGNANITSFRELKYFKGITSIADKAFAGCTNLTSIVIPKNVQQIGSGIFSGCNALEHVSISPLNHNYKYDNSNCIIETATNKLVAGFYNTIIPNNIISIENSAFEGCNGLQEITIPVGVTSIGNNAFYECNNLVSVKSKAKNPISFGENAFESISPNCTLTIPPGTRDRYIAAGWTEDIFKGGIVEDNSIITFEDDIVEALCLAWDTNEDGYLSYEEATAVTTLGNIFRSNTQITTFDELQYFTGLTSIGNSAFSGCSGLTSVTIPESVTSIGYPAFEGCSGLTKAEFASIESLCSISFSGSTSNPLYYAHHLYIDGKEVTDLVIPESVTSIGVHAFNGCSGLTSVTIPESVTSIGSYAFNGCSGLTKAEFASIESLCSISFFGYFSNPLYYAHHLYIDGKEVTDLVIPESVTSIGSNAFEGCSGLTSVVIPESVTSIGDDAFSGCSGLTSVTIPESVTLIGDYAFSGNNLLYIYFLSSNPVASITWSGGMVFGVPEDAVDAYKQAWPIYANRIVPMSMAHPYEVEVTAKDNSSAVVEAVGEGNALGVVKLKVTGSINSYDLMVFRNKMINLHELDLSEATVVGNSYNYYSGSYPVSGNFNSKDNVITGCFIPGNIFSLKLPKGITRLESGAFYQCTNLQALELPEGITSIPGYAFSYCSNISSIVIPEGVTSIGSYAFQSCNALASISLPSTLESIGGSAFYGCSNLTDIHLPANLKTVSGNAFSGCSGLKELRLPPYVQTIEDYSFWCSNLNDVYAYMPDIVKIGQNTFYTYRTATLYVPEFLYYNYYYDTQWSQFLNVRKTSLKPDDYLTLPTNSDITFQDGDERIPDTSDGEHIDGDIGEQGGVTVEGDEPQPFDEVDQNQDGDGTGGSLIGDDDGENQGNMPVNCLHVKIKVKANRWYFFCFPFDVVISECQYPGQYAWRQYDGLLRALQGTSGWKNVEGDRLEARKGYIFQSSKAGTLVVSFVKPTFGGERPCQLAEHNTDNKQHANWNFVGNPYSCYYDFQASDYSAPITVWNGTSYQAYRPGDDDYHLRPYEAFFVQKPSGTEKIDFRPEHRETYRQSQNKQQANQIARLNRGTEPTRRLVNLALLNGEGTQLDRTRVVLNDEASCNYELECDAAKFLSQEAQGQLYTVEQGVQMSINERPLEGDVRLGYTAKKPGQMSISAERMDHPMLLIDTEMGLQHDLATGPYDFQAKAGTHNTRFLLRENGNATGITQMSRQTGVAIGTREGGLTIGGGEGKTVSIYTINGAQVAQHTGNGFVALQRGIYVVSVDGMSAKVIVK